MKFREGQKVVFLHDSGGGIIKTILPNGKVIVEDESGFDQEYLINQLGAVYSEDYRIREDQISGINEDESFSTAKHQVTQGVLTGSRKPIEVWELDLHIEEITDTHAGWSNADILRKQMQELRTFFKKARGQRIRKLVIIHGVGSGVLRDEVRAYFQDQSNIDYYDADFREYGKGATAVELRYNG